MTLRIASARNDILVDETGRRYIDLFSAHGTVWLGHAHPAIAARVAEQLRRVWVTGGLETAVFEEARAAVEAVLPASHGVAALYSTGMEAAEFAIRVARVVTGRPGVAGFERSMHGKSVATAYLGWYNRDGVALPSFHRLPFVPVVSEDEILDRLGAVLGPGTVGAVFVEPLQASGGGHMASPPFYGEVARLCRRHGAMLVFDEILTGFHRTGPPFFFSGLGLTPDIVLIGKAMGNGFPVSGVVLDRRHAIRSEMLPGSTYAGNALASAAVAATVAEMRALDLPAAVARIERTVADIFGPLRERGLVLRGRGALWVLELATAADAQTAVADIFGAGVAVGYTGRQLRILPAATIEPDNLARACAVIARHLPGAGA